MLAKQILIVSGFLAAAAIAAPAPQPPVLDEWDTEDGGHFTVYGDIEGHSPSTPLQRRQCVGEQPVCSGSNKADAQTCAQLISSVLGPRATETVPESPRHFCLEGSGGKCCISWESVVTNAIYQDFVEPTKAMLNACQNDDGASALMKGQTIGQSCSQVCLSNRAKHC